MHRPSPRSSASKNSEQEGHRLLDKRRLAPQETLWPTASPVQRRTPASLGFCVHATELGSPSTPQDLYCLPGLWKGCVLLLVHSTSPSPHRALEGLEVLHNRDLHIGRRQKHLLLRQNPALRTQGNSDKDVQFPR